MIIDFLVIANSQLVNLNCQGVELWMGQPPQLLQIPTTHTIICDGLVGLHFFYSLCETNTFHYCGYNGN